MGQSRGILIPVTKKKVWNFSQINVHSDPPISKETVHKNELEVSASSFSAPTHISLSFVCYIM